MSPRRKFIADSMLGNLARWLRMLGYDTEYWRGDDAELIAKTESTKRILLTRDRQLAERLKTRDASIILIGSTELASALAQLSRKRNIDIKFNEDKTRCPLCNTQLGKLESEGQHRKKWGCPSCGKTYWIGSHWRNISRKLKQAQVILRNA